MKESDDTLFIAKKLSGELSVKEEWEFDLWLKSNPENEILFNQIKKIWEYSGHDNKEYNPATDTEWEKFKSRTESLDSEPKVLQLKQYSWAKIAAAIIVIVVSGWGLKYLFFGDTKKADEILQLTEVITNDSITIFYLPDSSKIYLNKTSSLAFAEGFSDTARITYLKGEAYFEVARNGKPFFVYAGGAIVRVMGTSFNVKANDDEDEVEVEVVEGKILFKEQYDSGSLPVILEKNDKVIFSKKEKSITKSKSYGKHLWRKGVRVERKLKNLFNKVKRKVK